MPLVFLNGASPDYTGFTFTDGAVLLNTIRDTLVSAGWTMLTETAGSTVYLQGTSVTNSHPCYMQFSVKTNGGKTNGRYLVIRGWQTYNAPTTFTTASPDDTLRLEFIQTGTNRLWLTADQEAGAVCIFASDGTSGGMHFGFLDRISQTDQWAWMVGFIHARGYEWAYVAKSGFNSTNWRLLVSDYNVGTNYSDYLMSLPVSTFDLTMRGKPRDHYNDTTNTNAFRSAPNGRLNYDGKAVVDPYYYLEGRGSTTAYAILSALYFRGLVKFAYCGLASQNACLFCTDPTTNYRILSVGGLQWQGMRIL
jgi:hypothetical protein